MSDKNVPDWEVPLREYAENLDAIKGKDYTESLVTWAHVSYLLGSHAPDRPPGSVLTLAMDLGERLKLDEKDMVAVLRLFARAKEEARGR